MKNKKNWAWAIAIVYTLFVVTLIGLLIFSFFNQSDLVSEDYYAQELKYQQQIERINRSQKLSKPIKFDYNKAKKVVSLKFSNVEDPRKIAGKIIFFRPSDARQDKTVIVKLDDIGKQIINVKSLSSGFWRVKVFWKWDNLEYYDEHAVVIE